MADSTESIGKFTSALAFATAVRLSSKEEKTRHVEDLGQIFDLLCQAQRQEEIDAREQIRSHL